MSQISIWGPGFHVSYLSSLSYSLYCKPLVQCEAPAVWFARADVEPKRREREQRKKEKPSAGHNFHWQLVNKLKQRDAGTIFPPLFSLSLSRSLSLISLSLSLSLSPPPPPPLSVSDNWCFSQKSFLEVMDTSQVLEPVEGIYHSGVVHAQ